MPRGSKSSVPCANVVVNPYFGKALQLVKSTPHFRSIAEEIRSCSTKYKRPGVGPHNVDVAAMLASGDLAALKAAFIKQMQRVVDAEPPKPVLGPPPNTVEVYGRFGRGSHITDIGSGNGMKLRRFTGSLTILAVEPKVTIHANICASIRATAEAHLPTIDPRSLLTSWMSLPQLDPHEIELVFQFDGCHGVPDHPYLLSLGAARHEADKIIVNTGSVENPTYTDTPLLDLEGFEVEPGYLIVPSFAQRNVTVNLNVFEHGPPAVIDAHPIDLCEVDWRDVGYKWDGTAYELELHEGSAWLTNRAGLSIKGQYACPDIQHLCVHLELVPTPGTTSTMSAVVLRVVTLNGMIPPHCGPTLRLFADKVNISFNITDGCAELLGGFTNVHVFGPPPYVVGTPAVLGGIKHPCDGVICRSGGEDFYCKPNWTIDITPDMKEAVQEAVERIGLRCSWVGNPGQATPGHLHQYAVQRDGHTVLFVFDRHRSDKLKPTTIDTVVHLCGLTTLEEDAAIEGHAVTD